LIIGIILALFAGFGFAGSAVFIRISLKNIGLSGATVISLFASTIFALIAASIFHMDEIILLQPTTLLWFLLIGGITFAGGRSLQYLAIKHLGAAKASAIVSASPLFASVLAVVFINESITIPVAIGTISILIGLITVSYNKNESSINQSTIITTHLHHRKIFGQHLINRATVASIFSLGAMYGIIAALMYGISAVLGKKVTSDLASPLVTTGFSLLFGLILTSIIMGRLAFRDIKRAKVKSFITVVIAGFFSASGVSFWLFSLSKASVVVVMPIIAIYPLITIIMVKLLLKGDENITKKTIIGTFIVIIGVISIGIGNI
jgi:drug/metabolite transporter (DMT)-like permease